MRKFPNFNSFGELNHGFHEGQSLLIHTKNETVTMYDFNSLSIVSQTSFKQSIVRTLVPVLNKQLSFRAVVVTEDQMGHLIFLRKGQIEKTASVDLQQPLTLCYTLLLDGPLNSYILFENGSSTLISRKKIETIESNWPPKTMTRITHLEPYRHFSGQKLIGKNSAGFLAYHYANNTCQITSWIMIFPNRRIINGLFSIQVNPNSRFLSPYYFLQDRDLYTTKKFKKIATLPKDVYTCSTYLGESSIFLDSDGQLYKVKDHQIEKLREFASIPLRVEYNGDQFVYLTMNGLINDKLNINIQLPLSTWANFFTHPSYPKVFPVHLVEAPPSKPCALKFQESLITSNSGGKWTPPHKIVSFNSVRVGQYDFFVAATAGTVHILKSHLKNPSILPVFECNWDTPISAVAINSKLFVVSSADNPIKIQQYSGDEYTFNFESSLCISLSLSETTLAAGFVGGSFILLSLKDKSQIISLWPFRVPITKLSHFDDEGVLVQWGKAMAKLTPKALEWVKLPSFPGALGTALSRQGLLSLGTTTTTDVYSFPDATLIAKIPQRPLAMCENDRRTYILTMKNEVVVLHYHSSLKVDAQFVIDVDNPYGILATDDFLFVLCQRSVSTFDKTGQRIADIELQLKPKFYDSTSKGIYLFFHKSIWYIQNKDNIKKIRSDYSNALAFSAVDDKRYIVASNGRLFYVEHHREKPMVSALSKYEKPLMGMKCYASQVGGKLDKIFLLYEDHSSHSMDIPALRDK